MGVPGAGKSRVAAEYTTRGYTRLNRDERGGSLRELAAALDEELAAGGRRVVLDNTYLTRASRNEVIEVAARHGIPARCVWLETPLAQAQVNLVERLLERFGSLPTPAQLWELRQEPGMLAPTSQMRAFRELEPPSDDEGFAAVEHVPFVRASSSGKAGVFVAARAMTEPGLGGRARAGCSGRAAPRLRLESGRRREPLSTPPRPASPRRSPGPCRPRSARIPPARRPAGAGRRCPVSRSRSPASTASTRRARS